MKEIWKPVPSLPEYEASSLGRIRRVPFRTGKGQGGNRWYGGHEWHGVWAADAGRYIFQFRGTTYKVARVVCEAFNGPSPFKGAVVMHLDENSRNNRPENLAWGTQRQNLNAPGFIKYCCDRTGEKNPYVKGRKRKQQK